LVAFDKAGMAVAASSNATASLGPVPALGATMGREHFDHVARPKITQALAAPEIAWKGSCARGETARRLTSSCIGLLSCL
jgi:hypothetical protein